jgi:putative phage-type endonuclease
LVTFKTFATADEWRAARTVIGGSDAAALVGLNPYKTNIELWQEKTGRRTAPDISNEAFVKFGHDAEPLLRELFALDHPQYDVGYVENNMFFNDKFPFAHASLDGWLVEKETGRKGILEIKTTNILQSMQKEKWNDRIPDNYYCQVLWYLMVTEFDFAVLKARLRSEWQGEIRVTVRHYLIERSEVQEDIDELEKAGWKMWKAIQEDREPYLILPAI